MNFQHIFIGAAALSLAACATPSGSDVSVENETATAISRIAAAETSADRIEQDILFLADDLRQGREAGTQGYEDAAKYVAARFENLGLTAAGDDGWFQSVTLRSATRELETAKMTLTDQSGQQTDFVHLDDYLIGLSMAEASFDVSAPAVFVGYGVSAPEIGHDDFDGVDVRGKIVVAFSGTPGGLDSEKRAFYRSNDYKMRTAAENGAVGFVTLLSASQLERFSWDRLTANPQRARTTWVHPDGIGEISAREIRGTATLSPAGAEKLFAGTQYSYADLQKIESADDTPLPSIDLNKKITLQGSATFSEETSPNVAGMIKGNDPVLANEVLVLTAHLDHVGVNQPRNGGNDFIHNGAMDNAMGVSAMLEAARAFKSGVPPKRTVVFLAVTAEEKGLIGSDYFAHYPTVAKEQIVANVNLDMPLALFPFTDVIAFGAERSSLGAIVQEAAASMNVGVIPDPIPEQGIFTRSDHYRFVEQGIPSVFLFIGFGNGGEEVFSNFMREHYHQPSDDLQLPINYEAAARFADLNYAVARQIADAEKAPSWIEGDFFGELFGK